MLKLVVNVDDPADLLTGYGAGALIRVERASSSTFSGATEITTIPLVDGTSRYEKWDTTGTSSDWYRVRYSTSSPSVATDYKDVTGSAETTFTQQAGESADQMWAAIAIFAAAATKRDPLGASGFFGV